VPEEISETAPLACADVRTIGAPGVQHAARSRGAPFHWRAILGALVAVPALVLAVLQSLTWIGTPFPGFFVMENAVIASIGGSDWPPDRAELFHAEVVAIDGTTVHGSADVYGRTAAAPVGTVVRYALRRGGTLSERAVPTRTFSWVAWVEVYATLLMIGLCNFGGAIAVVFLQPTLRSARVYFWTTLVGGVFATSAVFLHQPGFPLASRIYFLAEALFPATFVHLGMVFPVDRLRAPGRRWWPAVPYALAAVLAAVKLRQLEADPPGLTALQANYAYIAASFVFFAGSALVAYRQNADPAVRPRLRIVLLGVLAGSVLSFATFVDNAALGGRIPMQLGVVFVTLFFLAVAYAIGKHDLFDVDRVVRQGFVYGTLSVIVVGTYAGVLLVPAVFAPDRAASLQVPLGVAFVLLLALALDPLRRVVQRAVDRAFYRSRVDYRDAIESLSEALSRLVELPEVVTHVTRVVTDVLQVDKAAVALRLAGDQRPAVWTRDHVGHLTRSEGDRAIATLLDGLAGGSADVAYSTDGALPSDVREVLEAAGAVLALPLFAGERTIGVLLLGPRRSGRPFELDDLGLLRTLARQTAMALHNARSYEELAALTRDLDARVRQRTDELHASNERLSVAYTELQRTQAKLVHSEKMSSLGQLVAGVAHELNNPASFVYGSLTNLTEYVTAFLAVIEAYERLRPDDDAWRTEVAALRARHRLDYLVAEAPELLRICAEGSERIRNIVADLKAFARPGGTERVAVDVRAGIESTLRLLQHRTAAAGVRVVRHYRDVPPIQGAAGELNQVWMNVLGNAVDALAGRAGAELVVATRPATIRGEPVVEVEIRDNGPGIDPRDLPRLFEPFFTTKPVGQGTGLGLSIAYGAVKDHGGDITVTSTRGAGASFVVRLPIRGRAA